MNDKIILYTHSVDDIKGCIARICKCNLNDIDNYLSKHKNLIDEDVININLEEFFSSLGVRFANKTNLYEVIKFDKLVISHLSSRQSAPDDKKILCLADVLTIDTELSNFLKENGLKFSKGMYGLDVFYDGDLIDWDSFDKVYKYRIKGRLQKINCDNCINGFLFNDEIWKDSDVEHLMNCPEIIIDICNVLNRQNIISKYENISNSYVLGFTANISDIVYDYYFRYRTVKSKIYLTYKLIIRYLLRDHYRCFNPRFNNTKIRLKDNICVDTEDIIGSYIV